VTRATESIGGLPIRGTLSRPRALAQLMAGRIQRTPLAADEPRNPRSSCRPACCRPSPAPSAPSATPRTGSATGWSRAGSELAQRLFSRRSLWRPAQPEGCPLYFSHPAWLEHGTTGAHPERQARITAIESSLAERGWLGYEIREAPPASREMLVAVHSDEYVDAVRSMSDSGGGLRLHPDSACSTMSRWPVVTRWTRCGHDGCASSTGKCTTATELTTSSAPRTPCCLRASTGPGPSRYRPPNRHGSPCGRGLLDQPAGPKRLVRGSVVLHARAHRDPGR
jgi:hypothetical protein